MHRFKKKILHDKDRREYGGTKNGPGFDEKKKNKQNRKPLISKTAAVSLNKSINTDSGKSYICKCCKLHMWFLNMFTYVC